METSKRKKAAPQPSQAKISAPPKLSAEFSDFSDGDDGDYDLTESLAPLLLSAEGVSSGESLASIARAVTSSCATMDRFFEKFLRLQKIQARKMQEIAAALMDESDDEDVDVDASEVVNERPANERPVSERPSPEA